MARKKPTKAKPERKEVSSKKKAPLGKVRVSKKRASKKEARGEQKMQNKRERKKKSGNAVPVAVVGIGGSAGGLEAVSELLKYLPEDTGMTFVYVQHLDPTHKSELTSILSRVAKISVSEVKEDDAVKPNHLFVIPPGKDLFLKGGSFHLRPRTDEDGSPASINTFFRSLAEDQKSKSIGVVLSGNASDGSSGLQAIKDAGGFAFAQDEDSAKYPSMPHCAVLSGATDAVLSPKEIASELKRLSATPGVFDGEETFSDDGASRESDGKKDDALEKILQSIRLKIGRNFSHYKMPTLRRRIQRQMALHRCGNTAEYADFLEKNPDEYGKLRDDMLINVTSFFRDEEYFEYLKKHVFPDILENKKRDEPIRVWVAGCSTGEEAYTIAMLLTEYLTSKKRHHPIQVFGSDLSAQNIEKAREGIYEPSIEEAVSPARLRRFFAKAGGQYKISKEIRAVCVFAVHDLLTDPPFSRMDLVTCRNLLIYLKSSVQKKILPIFHYALAPDGYLMLGKSESATGFADLFESRAKKFKIYKRREGSRRKNAFTPIELNREDREDEKTETDFDTKRREINGTVQSESGDLRAQVDRLLLSSNYVLSSVVVDEQMEILQFRGDLSAYLSFPSGEATWNILKIAHSDLEIPLRTAIGEAKRKKTSVIRENVEFSHKNRTSQVNIKVTRMSDKSHASFFLVVFDSLREGVAKGSLGGKAAPQKSESRRVKKLRDELDRLKDHLKITDEEAQGIREEFQSTNEELESANEELQSSNEELETAKEELQSTNEELTTVNEELQTTNTELTETNNDLNNVFDSSRVAMIILDRSLNIRRFTPVAEASFKLQSSDVGRSINHIELPKSFPDIEKMVFSVLDDAQPRSKEVADKKGYWHTLWVRPYKTAENTIDGVVITLIDIDAVKRGEQALEEADDYSKAVLSTMREPLVVLHKNMRVKSCNDAFYHKFRVSEKETVEKRLYDLGDGQWDINELHIVLEKILSRETSFKDFEVTSKFPKIGTRTMHLNGRRLENKVGSEDLILLAIDDVTRVKEKEEELQSDVKRYRALFDGIDEGYCVLEKIQDSQNGLDFLFTEANNAFQKESGLKMDVLGKTLDEIFPEQNTDAFKIFDDVLRTGKSVHFQQILKATGRTLEIYAFRREAFKICRVGVIFKDVTERKALQERNDLFMSMASHELKTPLTTVKTLIQLLGEHLKESDDDDALDYLSRLDGQTNQLTNLVSDLLDVSKIKTGKLVLQKKSFDFDTMVREVLENYQSLSPNHTLKLFGSAKVKYYGDRNRVAQVLVNLIVNAVKYSPKKSTVKIHMSVTAKKIEVSVTDSGMGVKKEEQEKIFGRAFQLGNRKGKSYTGLGIGLYISKTIVEQHGGTIQCESKGEGKGAVFSFALPRKKKKK